MLHKTSFTSMANFNLSNSNIQPIKTVVVNKQSIDPRKT